MVRVIRSRQTGRFKRPACSHTLVGDSPAWVYSIREIIDKRQSLEYCLRVFLKRPIPRPCACLTYSTISPSVNQSAVTSTCDGFIRKRTTKFLWRLRTRSGIRVSTRPRNRNGLMEIIEQFIPSAAAMQAGPARQHILTCTRLWALDQILFFAHKTRGAG